MTDASEVMEHTLVRAMQLVQAFVHGSSEVGPTLHELSNLASEATDADMAGLTVRDERGRPTTVVYTDPVVPDLDQAQYATGRGPCLDAAHTHTAFAIEDMLADDRWPEFAAAAAAQGVRSSLSVPVVAAGNLGALTFYDRRAAFFDDEKERVAALFAGQCAVIGRHWYVANQAANLAHAMESRPTIEQAKGIIMATTGCSPEDAFGLLRRQSQCENRKLREIAEELVARQAREPRHR